MDLLATFVTGLARSAGYEVGPTPKPGVGLAGLDPDLIAAIGLERLERIWAVFRAGFRALAGYEPRPYPDRLALVRAVTHRLANRLDPTRGWDKFAAGGSPPTPSSAITTPLLRLPTVAELAAFLESQLLEDPGAP